MAVGGFRSRYKPARDVEFEPVVVPFDSSETKHMLEKMFDVGALC